MPDAFRYDVFLSHSSKDKEVVRALAERLRKDGLRVWFDEWEIKPRDSIPAKIEDGLEHSRVLVLCMSANAFGSDWAQLESGTFRFRDPLNKDRRFIPLRLDEAPIKNSVANFSTINWLPDDREQEYPKLLESCQSPANPPVSEAQNSRKSKQSEIVDPNKTRILVPSKSLLRPLSPFERRLLYLPFRVPSPGTPEAAHLQRLMDMDVAFQLKCKMIAKRLPHILSARLMCGSGLQMAKLLRSYFIEYCDRLFKHGPGSLPTSFNVVESFMFFDRDYGFFDLHNEVEHLLSINDYFRWYEKGEIPKDPRMLEEIMKEGTIYSYEMVSDARSYRISGDSQQVFAGIAFVRHNHELSCLLLAGENPPLFSDKDVTDKIEAAIPAPGREDLLSNLSQTTKDRYLDGYPDFAKVILLTRFDLKAGKHDVRYVNQDLGPAFRILTDDLSVLEGLPPEDAKPNLTQVADELKRYDDLFAALSSMIYLPAFFAAYPGNVYELEVATELHTMREDRRVRNTIKELGESQCVTHRKIRCLPVDFGINDGATKIVDPPPMEFKCDGYWKPIGPQKIGEGKNGEKLFGRTWVSRYETWSARSPQSFTLVRFNSETEGPDPGIVYIQRSPAHEINLYKVGFSKRNAQVRAGELSSATGVPLPFGVLASWQVGDCTRIEQEVHLRLAPYRINPRREFFRAELSLISRTINSVVEAASAD
ncbi:MAG: TIR domain-containing protein [Planctomycetes bacterium]|nr:TIR domain-containing protein [Planctomycetota bacterium]